jgi:hypothetical protein
MDARLQRRYVQLVEGHVNVAQAVAAGVHSLPGVGTTFAATQAAWRFLNNPRVTLPALAEPLQQLGREAANASASAYALVAYDWSKLDYDGHGTKQDLRQLGHELNIGYEMSAALLIDAANGNPLAPMAVAVLAADGMHTTAHATPQPQQAHLEQVLPLMRAAGAWGIDKTLVYVIDREADSVKHMRAWSADGHRFLVRADDRLVTHDGQKRKIAAIAQDLADELAAAKPRDVSIRGQAARQYTAETAIVLSEPGWTTNADGRNQRVPGPPLPLRLIVTQVRDDDGTQLAEWWLLTNVGDVAAECVAEWYYWRWRIESFHKLLKSAGFDLEEWGQETAAAITRRLLIACMACVTVWQLRAQESPAARECRKFIVRLSGRQMKHNTLDTAPALLAGLFVLLAMVDALQDYTPDEIREFARIAVPHLRPPQDGVV